MKQQVSMPSRAYTSFLRTLNALGYDILLRVSMPSRAYTSFLQQSDKASSKDDGARCQCPLGLIPHFYGTPSKT